MTNLCKCGHTGTSEEFQHWHNDSQCTVYDCLCKKFEPNHSPSEDVSKVRIETGQSSGGDSPQEMHKTRVLLPKAEDTLSSKIIHSNEGDWAKIIVPHIKDFIQKLKEEFMECSLDEWGLCEKIDKLAGDELT